MNLEKFKLLLILVLFLTPANSETLDALKNTHQYSLYTGTFDTLDKEGDDQTTLVGFEHQNTELFRNTILGKFSPITGGFISGKDSVYLYTGIEALYGIGPLKIRPSFSPGYYNAGDGKELGSALEFKSEISFDINIFNNTKIGYSYNHISNNDWGNINPGINNKHFSFSKIF
jgi:lipid A 3-O-deacylase